LSAVVGSLSCALLLVIALGITYRFVCLPSNHRTSRHISPITAIEEQIYAQRSAPPQYQEAMATSRPFDEYQREIVGHLNQTAASQAVDCRQGDDGTDDTSALVRNAPNTSDDDLLDVSVDEAPGGDGDENIVIALGCLARWHRHPKPSADSCESSISAMDSLPSNPAIVCDDQPVVEVTDTADTLTEGCDVGDTATPDHPNDDDDQPLLKC